jgi:hypothetical protein
MVYMTELWMALDKTHLPLLYRIIPIRRYLVFTITVPEHTDKALFRLQDNAPGATDMALFRLQDDGPGATDMAIPSSK